MTERDDFEASLDEADAGPVPYLDIDGGPPAEEYLKGASHIDADRLLRRLAVEQKRLAEIRDLVAERQLVLKRWQDDMSAGPARVIEWVTRALEGYMRAEVAAGGPQSLKLPNGTLKVGSTALSLKVDDVMALDVFVRQVRLGSPEAPIVELVPTAHVARLKKLVDAASLSEPACTCSTAGAVWSEGQSSTVDPDCLVHGPREGLDAVYMGAVVPGVHFTRPRQGKFDPRPVIYGRPVPMADETAEGDTKDA